MQAQLQRQAASVRPAAARHNIRIAARPTRVVCSAASFSAGGEDPYTVLGVKPDADSNAINRAYRQRAYDAKIKGNQEEMQRIEAAMNKLMMSSLSARLSGKATVNSAVKYADREPLFPWRPKRWDATPKVILIIGALQMAIMAYGFQSPNMSKVIASMLVGVAGNVLKQNAISPPPSNAMEAPPEEEGRAGRNFVRGALLGVLATFAGVLVFSAPEMLATVAKASLPDVLTNPGTIVSLKVAGAALSNWVMTSFYY